MSAARPPRFGGRVLHRDGDCSVILEDDGATVAKSYPAGPAGALRAASELERLRQMHAALESIDGVACPRPIGRRDDGQPVVLMEYIDGVATTSVVAARWNDAEFAQHLARRLVAAAEAYVDATGEAMPDLHFRNSVHRGPAGTGGATGAAEIVLLDLGDPIAGTTAVDGAVAVDPVAVSVVRLAGSTLFECARPQRVLRVRQGVGTARVAGTALAIVAGRAAIRGGSWGVTDLLAATDDVHRQLARGGGRLRRAWYATGGPVAARLYRRALRRRCERG